MATIISFPNNKIARQVPMYGDNCDDFVARELSDEDAERLGVDKRDYIVITPVLGMDFWRG